MLLLLFGLLIQIVALLIAVIFNEYLLGIYVLANIYILFKYGELYKQTTIDM